MKLGPAARFSTVCLHAGQTPDPSTGAIVTPIYQTSTYVQEALGRHKGYEYARTQNPTRAALEGNIAAMEKGKAAFAFASGMAAIDAITTLLKAGDHVVVSDNVYGGTVRLFEKPFSEFIVAGGGPVTSWSVQSDGNRILGLQMKVPPSPPPQSLDVILNWLSEVETKLRQASAR